MPIFFKYSLKAQNVNFLKTPASEIVHKSTKPFFIPKMKVSTSNILMTHPKNAKDQTQYPQIIAAMAISIAATTFVDHPLVVWL